MLKAIHWIIDHMPKPIQNCGIPRIRVDVHSGGRTDHHCFSDLPDAAHSAVYPDAHGELAEHRAFHHHFVDLRRDLCLFTNKKYVFQSVTDTRAAFWRELYMFYGARAVTYFLELAIMEGGNHFFATVNGEIVTWRSLVVRSWHRW